MKLVEIQEHLTATGIFSAVHAVLSIQEINKQSIKKPVAFVAPAGTSALPNIRDMGAAIQPLTESYSVVYCIPSINDKTGLKASQDLQTIITLTRKDMISYAPSDAELMTFEGGELMMIEGGFVLWQDQFSTQYHLEGN